MNISICFENYVFKIFLNELYKYINCDDYWLFFYVSKGMM